MAFALTNQTACAGRACPLWGGEPGGCLRRIAIFRDLTDIQARVLRRAAKPTQVEEGQVLFAAGDLADHILLVVRGLVKIARTDAAGHQHITRLLRTGDHFGSEYLFASETMPFGASALAASHVCFVPLTQVEQLISDDASLAARIITAMARQLRHSDETAAKLALADAEQRLAGVLLDLGDEVGRPAGPGRLHVRLPVSRPDLASLVGIAPETVSRRLGELQAQGAVLLHGHRGLTIIDRPLLVELAGRTAS